MPAAAVDSRHDSPSADRQSVTGTLFRTAALRAKLSAHSNWLVAALRPAARLIRAKLGAARVTSNADTASATINSSAEKPRSLRACLPIPGPPFEGSAFEGGQPAPATPSGATRKMAKIVQLFVPAGGAGLQREL